LRYYLDGQFAAGGQPAFKHSDSSFERAVALDPNLIFAAARLIVSRTDRGEIGIASTDASGLVKRRPESASAHFAFSYVLRYAGLLNDAARECNTALSLDSNNYQFRTCAWVFMELGKPQRAMDFVRLDASSEWAAYIAPSILLRQGKLDEARESVKRMSANPRYHRDLLRACLDPQQATQLKEAASEVEAAVLVETDPEPRFFQGTILAYCGQEEAAVRVLKSAIEHNYCAYNSLQTDPLLARLRGTPKFSDLLSAAKECQNRFVAEQEQSPLWKDADPYIPILKEAKAEYAKLQ